MRSYRKNFNVIQKVTEQFGIFFIFDFDTMDLEFFFLVEWLFGNKLFDFNCVTQLFCKSIFYISHSVKKEIIFTIKLIIEKKDSNGNSWVCKILEFYYYARKILPVIWKLKIYHDIWIMNSRFFFVLLVNHYWFHFIV